MVNYWLNRESNSIAIVFWPIDSEVNKNWQQKNALRQCLGLFWENRRQEVKMQGVFEDFHDFKKHQQSLGSFKAKALE